jgi:drug/metabolite transporter (DMT)-like permease
LGCVSARARARVDDDACMLYLDNNTSLVLLFLAPTSQAPTAVVVALFQLQPVIALIWAAVYWREYDDTPARVKSLAVLTAVLFGVACVLFCLNVYIEV